MVDIKVVSKTSYDAFDLHWNLKYMRPSFFSIAQQQKLPHREADEEEEETSTMNLTLQPYNNTILIIFTISPADWEDWKLRQLQFKSM